jgi:hypothetical protein
MDYGTDNENTVFACVFCFSEIEYHFETTAGLELLIPLPQSFDYWD